VLGRRKGSLSIDQRMQSPLKAIGLALPSVRTVTLPLSPTPIMRSRRLTRLVALCAVAVACVVCQTVGANIRPRRTWQGIVFSNKMKKTITVVVSHNKWVEKYGVWHKRSRKFHAHDEGPCQAMRRRLPKRSAAAVPGVSERMSCAPVITRRATDCPLLAVGCRLQSFGMYMAPHCLAFP
jgi:hypothetical protein